jgi:hypothetical protein
MASGRVDTMTDYLRQIMGSLSEAKIVADADLPFLLSIEQMIVAKLRDPITRMQQQGIMPSGPQQVPAGGGDPGMMGMDPSMGGMGGGMPPGPQPQLQGMGGVRGVSTAPSVPSSDELRRLLTNNQ